MSHLVRSILGPGRWMLIHHVNPFRASPFIQDLVESRIAHPTQAVMGLHALCHGNRPADLAIVLPLASVLDLCVELRAEIPQHGQLFSARVHHPTSSNANTFSFQLQGWMQTREKPRYSNQESYSPIIKRKLSPLHVPSNPASFLPKSSSLHQPS